MITYLLIGAIVQCFGIVERAIRGVSVSPRYWDIYTIIVLAILIPLNILSWPLYIIAEGYNIYHEQ